MERRIKTSMDRRRIALVKMNGKIWLKNKFTEGKYVGKKYGGGGKKEMRYGKGKYAFDYGDIYDRK